MKSDHHVEPLILQENRQSLAIICKFIHIRKNRPIIVWFIYYLSKQVSHIYFKRESPLVKFLDEKNKLKVKCKLNLVTQNIGKIQ